MFSKSRLELLGDRKQGCGMPNQERTSRGPNRYSPIGQGARVGESWVNFPANFAARRSRDSVHDVLVARKKVGAHTDTAFK